MYSSRRNVRARRFRSARQMWGGAGGVGVVVGWLGFPHSGRWGCVSRLPILEPAIGNYPGRPIDGRIW